MPERQHAPGETDEHPTPTAQEPADGNGNGAGPRPSPRPVMPSPKPRPNPSSATPTTADNTVAVGAVTPRTGDERDTGEDPTLRSEPAAEPPTVAGTQAAGASPSGSSSAGTATPGPQSAPAPSTSPQADTSGSADAGGPDAGPSPVFRTLSSRVTPPSSPAPAATPSPEPEQPTQQSPTPSSSSDETRAQQAAPEQGRTQATPTPAPQPPSPPRPSARDTPQPGPSQAAPQPGPSQPPADQPAHSPARQDPAGPPQDRPQSPTPQSTSRPTTAPSPSDQSRPDPSGPAAAAGAAGAAAAAGAASAARPSPTARPDGGDHPTAPQQNAAPAPSASETTARVQAVPPAPDRTQGSDPSTGNGRPTAGAAAAAPTAPIAPHPGSHAPATATGSEENTQVLPKVHGADVATAQFPDPSAGTASGSRPGGPDGSGPTGGDGADDEGGGRPRRRGLLVVGALVALLVLAYLGDLLFSSGSVPRGVVVAGQQIGGLSRAAAIEKLQGAIEPRSSQLVQVTAGEVRSEVDPKVAGLAVDYPGTLDLAGAQPLNPITRITSFFGTRDVEVVNKSDERAVRTAMEQLAPDRGPRPEGRQRPLRGRQPAPGRAAAGPAARRRRRRRHAGAAVGHRCPGRAAADHRAAVDDAGGRAEGDRRGGPTGRLRPAHGHRRGRERHAGAGGHRAGADVQGGSGRTDQAGPADQRRVADRCREAAARLLGEAGRDASLDLRHPGAGRHPVEGRPGRRLPGHVRGPAAGADRHRASGRSPRSTPTSPPS